MTARDIGGNTIQGASVVLAATGSNNTLGQPGSTDGSGVATGSFSSTSLGTHTITAKINGVEVTDRSIITVTPGPVSASQSSVGAAPNAIPAGGGPATVTVTARDAAGNPISGASVSLSVSGGGNTVSAPAATNANGVTSATFTSTESGDHVITATINGVTIDDTPTVSVQAGPPASLSFVQGPSTTQAGQTINPPVSVAVRDQFGNLATGQVQMSLVVPFLGSGTLNGTTSVTAFVAIAIFTNLSVSSPALGYQLTATLGSLSVTSNGFIVTP